MATVIDELIIKIGLEVNDVKKQVAEVKKAVGSLDTQETKARTKKRKEEKVAHKEQVSNIKELEKTVLKFYAAISGGKALGAFVEDTVKSSANLERLSKSLNTSAFLKLIVLSKRASSTPLSIACMNCSRASAGAAGLSSGRRATRAALGTFCALFTKRYFPAF